jgi:spore coat protein CotH
MISMNLRRNYKLLIVAGFFIASLFLVGGVKIIAYTTGLNEVEIPGVNYENETALFEVSLMHEISISMDPEEYQNMIKTYQETGEKEYYRVDVTIDGVTIEDVGIRLKGNSTLASAVGGGLGNFGGRDFGGSFPEGFEPPEGFPMPGGGFPDNGEFPEDFGAPQGFGGMPRGGSDGQDEVDKEPGDTPFLLKFDEFIQGQTYQGYAEVAIRLGGGASLLNELVAFSIHKEVGQIVPETAYASVQIGDEDPILYVITEHLDEQYVDKYFPGTDGILYKAGNFIGFSYRGDDPSSYIDVYEQKTNKNDDDLYALIEFLKFVDESTDEEFANELGQWLDIESFITFMALDNLLANHDSFVGMGSNYYLYFNKGTEQFTMLSWDQNLAMGGMIGMGGRGGETNQDRENVMSQVNHDEAAFGEDIQMGDFAGKGFGDFPEGFDAEGMEGGPGGRMGNGENTLKDRFFENQDFSEAYDAEYARLQTLIFSEGLGLDILELFVRVFTDYNNENNLVSQEDYDADANKIRSFLLDKDI